MPGLQHLAFGIEITTASGYPCFEHGQFEILAEHAGTRLDNLADVLEDQLCCKPLGSHGCCVDYFDHVDGSHFCGHVVVRVHVRLEGPNNVAESLQQVVTRDEVNAVLIPLGPELWQILGAYESRRVSCVTGAD